MLFRISDDNFGNLYAYVAPEAITWADANGTQNDPTNVVGVKIYWSSVSITIGTMPAEFN